MTFQNLTLLLINIALLLKSHLLNATEIQWEAIPEASKYQLQISTDSTFSNLLFNEEVFRNQYSWQEPHPGFFYFRVAYFDKYSRQSPFSPMSRITIRLNRPSQLKTIAKKNKLTFTWKKSYESELYRVQVSKTPGFEKIVSEKEARYTKLSTSLPQPGSYYWRVRAENKEISSQWTEAMPFKRRSPAQSTTLHPKPLRKQKDITGSLSAGLGLRTLGGQQTSSLLTNTIPKGEFQGDSLSLKIDFKKYFLQKKMAFYGNFIFGEFRQNFSSDLISDSQNMEDYFLNTGITYNIFNINSLKLSIGISIGETARYYWQGFDNLIALKSKKVQFIGQHIVLNLPLLKNTLHLESNLSLNENIQNFSAFFTRATLAISYSIKQWDLILEGATQTDKFSVTIDDSGRNLGQASISQETHQLFASLKYNF